MRVDTQEREFRVDNVLGLWDVSARLRTFFAFVQEGLRGTEVDLREVEYAAANGMLHTLDPHSVLLSPEAVQGDEPVDERPVRRTRHRHLDPRSALTVINPMPNTPAGRAGVKNSTGSPRSAASRRSTWA